MSDTKNTQISNESPTVLLPLTKGFYAIIDNIDADLASLKWCASGKKERPYAVRMDKDTQKMVYLHRIILSRILSRTLRPNETADHIDNNSLNNCRNNIRLASHAENCRNSKRPTHNSSGYKGVSWQSSTSKWRAYIKVNQRVIHLGCFNSLEDAYAAYCEAAQHYFGEFARFE